MPPAPKFQEIAGLLASLSAKFAELADQEQDHENAIPEIQVSIREIEASEQETRKMALAAEEGLEGLEGFREEADYELSINPMRIRNAVQSVDGPLVALKTRAGVVPDGFPTTFLAITDLTEATLNQLLAAYGLPVDGQMEQKQRRLAAFIGREL